MSTEVDNAHAVTLQRGLRLPQSIALVVGGTIGTSIFIIPSAIANFTGSPFAALLTWCIAGFLAFVASFCLAELGAAIPETGGPYAFFCRTFRSRAVPFAYAWMMSFVYGPGAMAVVAIMTATFAAPYLSGIPLLRTATVAQLALLLLGLVCTINLLGVRAGGRVQSVLTAGKILLLIVVIVSAFAFLPAHFSAFQPPRGQSAPITLSGITAGLVLCTFAYNGAHFVTLVAGEVRRPTQAIPIAICVGMAIVTLLYLVFNTAILSTLPFATVTHSKRITFDLMQDVFGAKGAAIATIAVCSSGVAVLNAQCLGYPRILFSLSRDGMFSPAFAMLATNSRAPSFAILACTVCAAGYVFSGTYSDILGYMAFVSQFFMALVVCSLVVLRWREPELPRPYRAWGYPWSPAAYVLISAAYLIDLLVTKLATVMVGILVVAAGAPLYFYFRRNRKKQRVECAADRGV